MSKVKQEAENKIMELWYNGEGRIWKIAEIVGCSEAFVVATLGLDK